jgi:hypothetical protein
MTKIEDLPARSGSMGGMLRAVLARMTFRTAVEQDGRTLRRRFRMWEDET